MKFTTSAALLVFFSVLLLSCSNKRRVEYTYDPEGYYYKLLSFDEEGLRHEKWQIAHLDVVFKTQTDSIFWDSYNNLNDNFFVRSGVTADSSIFERCVLRYKLHDSVCLLMRTKDFYREQFNATSIPFFSRGDSVVKVNFRIKELVAEKDFARLRLDLERRETGRVVVFFGSREDMNKAKDTLGFYWVERPDTLSDLPTVKQGDVVNLSYKGYFLNGRFLEESPRNFELVYGMPDQVLKGINYVIPRLKMGQNAKIILPSRLAFGEKGSCNSLVPPFTPLLYEVTLNN